MSFVLCYVSCGHVSCGHVSCVMCHVSRITCHVSHVTCHMSHIFLDKVEKLVGGGSVINGASSSSLVWTPQ